MLDDSANSTEIAILERVLQQRTRERDDVQLRLVESDKALASSQAALKQTARQNEARSGELIMNSALLEAKELELAQNAANLAVSAIELSRKTTELYESNKFLANKTAQLEAANEELHRVMQLREDFVAALTHDLKNPITGTTRVLEHLLTTPELSDHYRQAVKTVIDSNKGMLRMISNMLDIYKHEAGAIIPVIEQVNIPDLLRNCISEFSFVIAEKNLDLQQNIGEPISSIPADRILVKRVMSNLLDNAIKFSPRGGKVVVGCEESDKEVVISVLDSGTGLNDLQRRSIFLRYWQTKEGRDKEIGTGLGLFISRQFVELLGGRIECDSPPGNGAKFTIRLPRPESA